MSSTSCGNVMSSFSVTVALRQVLKPVSFSMIS